MPSSPKTRLQAVGIEFPWLKNHSMGPTKPPAVHVMAFIVSHSCLQITASSCRCLPLCVSRPRVGYVDARSSLVLPHRYGNGLLEKCKGTIFRGSSDSKVHQTVSRTFMKRPIKSQSCPAIKGLDRGFACASFWNTSRLFGERMEY